MLAICDSLKLPALEEGWSPPFLNTKASPPRSQSGDRRPRVAGFARAAIPLFPPSILPRPKAWKPLSAVKEKGKGDFLVGCGRVEPSAAKIVARGSARKFNDATVQSEL